LFISSSIGKKKVHGKYFDKELLLTYPHTWNSAIIVK